MKDVNASLEVPDWGNNRRRLKKLDKHIILVIATDFTAWRRVPLEVDIVNALSYWKRDQRALGIDGIGTLKILLSWPANNEEGIGEWFHISDVIKMQMTGSWKGLAEFGLGKQLPSGTHL